MLSSLRSFKRMLNLTMILSILFTGVAFPSTIRADSTITVETNLDEINSNGLCSLREAIVNANEDDQSGSVDCTSGSGADTITLPAGTYTLTIAGANEELNISGDLDITDDLTINGAGVSNTIIQAGTLGYPDPSPNGIDRAIHIHGVTPLTAYISDITIANGNCLTPNLSCFGGGISVESSMTVHLTNIHFTGNRANAAGAIWNQGNLIIAKAIFSSNSTTTHSPNPNGHGGGIASMGALEIVDSTFFGNVATGVGGGIHTNGAVTVANTTFLANTADANGGGISIYAVATVTVTNSTFSDNMADSQGGGIYNFDGTLNVTNSTFSGNGAITGGGIKNDNILNLKNTILANSVGGADCYNNSGDIIATNINNLIETNSATGKMCGTPAVSADPNLSSLANNGGVNQTYALGTGSSAIDAGDNTVCAASPVDSLDQRGATRPQGIICDIGAYEKLDDTGFPTFEDVSTNAFAWAQIESIFAAGITGGCSTSPMNYCPTGTVTRAQMAIFLMRGIHGSAYTPPGATGTVFNDVAVNSFASAFIEAFAAEGITGGCGNGNYCPSGLVSRAQMAIFLLRAKYGSDYTPPTATGTMFNDVPSNSFAAAWIEQLATEGITGGCSGGNYCPNNSVTRAQMAVFLQKTFNVTLP